MKKICFFQVNFKIGFGNFATYWLPYGVAKLWSYAKQQPSIAENYKVSDFIFERLSYDSFSEDVLSSDIYAFSCYIWNWKWNLTIAKKIKDNNPNAIIIMGGPQIPEDSDKIVQLYNEYNFIDYTVHGEGEYVFVELLNYIQGNAPYPALGVTSPNNTNVTVSARIQDLSTLPSPFLDGVLDSIVQRHPDKNFSITLETNRGCPYQCTFCDWGSLTFNKVKLFPVNNVKSEIDWISKNQIRFVDVSDANFGIMKSRDFDLLKHMIKMKEDYKYPETYSFNWQKNSTNETLEMVEYLTNNGGSRGFTLSAQSMNDSVLNNIKRRNMDINDLSSIFQKCNLRNIQTYTELILGLPGETLTTWKDGLCRLLENGQHTNIEIWLCQMLENAELNSNEQIKKYQIETTPIHNYISGSLEENDLEGIHVIKSTKDMSFDELIDSYLYGWMITNFHSFGWTQIISRYLNVEQRLSYKEFYDDLLQFIINDELFSKFYMQVKEQLLVSFKTNMIHGKGMHYYISDYQKKMHQNRETVIKNLTTYVNRKYDLPTSVLDFTEHFITSWTSPKSKSIDFDLPIWHIINFSEYKSSSSYRYKFSMHEIAKDEEEYYDSFYFRRRKGWGKYQVLGI